MDKVIADLLASVAALTAGVKANTEILERVVAGQEAAMAKLEGSTGTTTRKPRATKSATADAASAADAAEPTPAPAPAPAEEKPAPAPAAEPVKVHPLLTAPNGDTKPVKNPKTGVLEDTPTAAFRAADFSREQVKAEFIGWIGETDDLEVRKERAAFVGAAGQHFGVKQLFHPTEGLSDSEQCKQALFFLRRKREGLAVDFSADYDFDGDPLADQTVDAAEDPDPLG